MSVSDILSIKGRSVVTISQDETLNDAVELLAAKKIGAVIVLGGEETVCGILSERDIVRDIAKNGATILGERVATCMTQNVVSCESGESIDSLMGKMTAGKFRHLPVIDNGSLTGIVSIGDVVKRKIEMAEQEAEEMKRYIAG